DVIVTQTGSGCSATSAAVNADVVADPTVTISGAANVCSGSTVTLTANVSGGLGTVSAYQWRRNGTNVGTNSATYTTDNTLSVGSYSYDVIVTQTGSGCSNTATSVNANVLALPQGSLTANGPFCATDAGAGTLTFTASPGEGIGPFSLNMPPHGTVSGVVSGVPFTPPGSPFTATTTFTISAIQDANGCVRNTGITQPSATITVNPAATVNTGLGLSGCQSATPAAITLSGASVGGGATTGAWSITSGGGTLSSTAQQNNAGIAATTYTPVANYTGLVVLTLTTNDPDGAGPCTAVSATRNITINPQPTITLGSVASVCVGSSTFSLPYTATTNGPNQYSISAGSPALSGFTPVVNASLPVSPIIVPIPTGAAPGTYQFVASVRNSTTGCSSPNYTFNVTIEADPIITTQPTTPVWVCINGVATLTVAASGGTGSFTYQWYWNDVDDNTGGYLLDNYYNANTATATVMSEDSFGTLYYYCVITQSGSGCNTVVSNTSAVTVGDPIYIITNPTTTQTVCIGGSSPLSVSAGGGVPSLTYQWYSNTTNSNSGGTLISGAIADTYSPPNASAGTLYYYCVVSASGIGCDPATSDVATVTVVADPSINISAGSATVCVGGITSLSATPANGTGTCTIQWQFSTVSNTGPWTNFGTGANPQTTPAITGTTYFRAVYSCTGLGCDAANSNVLTINTFSTTITSGAVGGAASLTQCVGGNPVAFTVGAPSGGNSAYTYQWEQSDGCTGTWVNAVAEDGITNTLTFNPPVLNSVTTMCYRLRITDGCSSVGYSTTKTYNVVAEPTLSTPSLTNSTICIGGSTAISTTVSGGTGTFNYQWQYSANGSTGWANVATGTPTGYTYTNAATLTLNITTTNSASPTTVYYRCVLSTNTPTGADCDATSANAVLTLVADPVSPTSATKSPNTTSVCEGATLTISAPTGGSAGVGCTLEYRVTQNGGGAFSTPSTTIPVLTADLGGYDAIEVRYTGCASGCETSAWQELARWTVIADPAITGTTQPTNPICPGGSGTFTVSATGGTDGSGATVRTQQWQYSADGSTGWANVVNGTPTGITYTGSATTSLTVSTTNASTPAGTYYYRVIVGADGTDCASVTSTVLFMTVNAEAAAPTATQSPTTTTVCAGTSLTLTNPVLGSGGAGTQVFEYSTVSGSSGFSATVPTITASVGNNSIWIRTNPTGSGCNISPATQYTWTGIANPSGGSISSVSFCTGTSAAVSVTGVSNATQYSWSLPAQLSGSSTTSSITVSSSTPGTYTVTVTPQNVSGGATCNGTPVTGTVVVNANNTAGAASSTPTLCINTALTDITHTTTGATGIGTAIGLPSGVTAAFASNTITISGTPTASGTFSYSIPLTGGCGMVSASGSITVTANNTVSAASSTPTLCINTALTPITHTTTGATGIGTASGLPSGVTAAFASNTITISGTPTESGTFSYSIPLTGGCGSVSATGTVTVNSLPTAGITGTTTICSGNTTTLTATGGVAYNWGSGFSATATFTTPALTNNTTYTVTVQDANGCTNSATTTITVNNLPV
ncbi:MAG TPA: hypothetical protein PK715_01580, partial [Chitinophagales bacterium]|nr:hypothetical protein [Chitinophagales bacterium]